MKKAFLLLCTLLLVLGSLLPLAGYRLAKAVLGEAAASSEVPASSALPAPGGSLPARTQALQRLPAFTGDAEVFLIEDQSTGEVQQVPAAGLSHRRGGSGNASQLAGRGP